MAYELKEKHALIEHAKSGRRRQAKIGYSWTTALFGNFVPLFRRDWATFLISTLVIVLVVAVLPDGYPTEWITSLLWIGFGFVYNDIYLKNALKGDWIPADAQSRNRLYEKGYVKTHCYDIETKN